MGCSVLGFLLCFLIHSGSLAFKSPSKMNQKNSSGFCIEFAQANLNLEEFAVSYVHISTT